MKKVFGVFLEKKEAHLHGKRLKPEIKAHYEVIPTKLGYALYFNIRNDLDTKA